MLKKKKATVIDYLASMRPTPVLRIFHSSSGTHRNRSSFKTNHMNVQNHLSSALICNSSCKPPQCQLLIRQPVLHISSRETVIGCYLTYLWILFYLWKQISAYLIQIGLRKFTFSSPWLTFGSECIYMHISLWIKYESDFETSRYVYQIVTFSIK